jgi:hypothetical protein
MSKNKLVAEDDMFDGFTKQQRIEHLKEAKKRWGNTEAWKQSQERLKTWTKEDFKKVKVENDTILRKIVTLMEKGPTDPEVQEEIEKIYLCMQRFYDCSYEMFRGLGQMYVDDKRFTATYDKYHPALAQFMRDAMAYYSDQHQK